MCCSGDMTTDRSHPPLTHWLLSPAAPGPPPSNPSWQLHAGACRRVEWVRSSINFSGLSAECLPASCLYYVRLESGIGAVDEVPVTDLLQNQQGTRLMPLRGTGGDGQWKTKISKNVHFLQNMKIQLSSSNIFNKICTLTSGSCCFLGHFVTFTMTQENH